MLLALSACNPAIRSKWSLTGGSFGIGLATVIEFAQEGAKVVIAARDPERGRRAVEKISMSGGQALFVVCDVRKTEIVRQSLKQFSMYLGAWTYFSITLALFMSTDRTVENTTEDEWAAKMETNVTGTFLMSKYAVPRMVENGGGVIIKNVSVFGLRSSSVMKNNPQMWQLHKSDTVSGEKTGFKGCMQLCEVPSRTRCIRNGQRRHNRTQL